MKRSIARKWAAALDSGEYEQCSEQLRSGKKFCCLGVLCNIHAQEHPDIAAMQKVKSKYMNSHGTLPDDVVEWASMSDDIGTFYGYGENPCELRSLTQLNDDEKLTFPEIAKVIRKHWKEL